jgi:hypothetical protein
MRTVLQVIKKTMHGAPSDQLAELEARLQAERKNAAAAAHEVEQLEQQRRMADDFDAARGLLGDRGVARGDRFGLELGEGVVQANIPTVAFMGLLLPDLIDIWAGELDRALAARHAAPPPAKAPAASRRPDHPDGNAHARGAVSLNRPPSPSLRVRRALRRDTEAGDNEQLVSMLRGGVEIAGDQTIAGDLISVPVETAKKLVAAGAAEFADDSTQSLQSGRFQETGKPNGSTPRV